MFSSLLKMKWSHVTNFLQSTMFTRIFVPSMFTVSAIAYYSYIFYLKFTLKPIEDDRLSPTTQFVKDRKKMFLEWWHHSDANSNIDDAFYDHEQYQKMLTDVTEMERLWKSRIMYDTTPLGNIVMYYDVYKHGFAYASDQTISYSILCASAMKYCKTFHCRDFFRDNQYTESEQLSPFTLMDIDQEKVEKRKKVKKRQELMIDFKSDAFLKPKSKRDVSDLPAKQVEKPEEEKPKDYYKNTFRYIGKMSNVSLLQKDEYKKEPEQKTTSYSSFKKRYQYSSNEQFNNFFMVDNIDMNVQRYG